MAADCSALICMCAGIFYEMGIKAKTWRASRRNSRVEVSILMTTDSCSPSELFFCTDVEKKKKP